MQARELVAAGEVEVVDGVKEELVGLEERSRAGDVAAMLEYLTLLEGVERAAMVRFQVAAVV